MAGFASYTARSAMRPDIDAGPIGLKCSVSNGPPTDVANVACCAKPRNEPPATAITTAVPAHNVMNRFMNPPPNLNNEDKSYRDDCRRAGLSGPRSSRMQRGAFDDASLDVGQSVQHDEGVRIDGPHDFLDVPHLEAGHHA